MVKRLVVCGLGKLGSPIAAVFAHKGVEVVGLDLDEEKVASLAAGKAPVDEPLLQTLLDDVNITATTDPLTAVRGSDGCIFVTATPSRPDGSFDNKYLEIAVTNVAKEVDWDAPVVAIEPYLFIIASTVSPGTCDKVIGPIIRKYCKRAFKLIYKPELIALGTVVSDLLDPDFILIGSSDDHGAAMATALYRKVVKEDTPIKCMTLLEAEIAKISLNCAITMKISFANQVGMLADSLGANAHRILDAVGEDSRIGHRALKPGMPFGGPCFPRDNRMFQHTARVAGVHPALAIATDLVNSLLIKYILKKIPDTGDVGILGLSYKAGTSITEESPGIKLQEALLNKRRKVFVHDPANPGKSSPLNVVLACPTIIVATAWPEYSKLKIQATTKLIDPMHVIIPSV